LGGRYYDLYTRQYGLESNLFLAPGEGDDEGPTADAQTGMSPTRSEELVPALLAEATVQNL
jgi:hypothetical protein